MRAGMEHNCHGGAAASCLEPLDGGQGSGSRAQWTPRWVDMDLTPAASLSLAFDMRLRE